MSSLSPWSSTWLTLRRNHSRWIRWSAGSQAPGLGGQWSTPLNFECKRQFHRSILVDPVLVRNFGVIPVLVYHIRCLIR